MTREEAIERVRSRFDKWALDDEDLKALQALRLATIESEDEKIIEGFRKLLNAIRREGDVTLNLVPIEKCEAWLEKQKENPEKEYVFRPLAGTDITIAAEQAIRRAMEGDHLVLAFNGWYIRVDKYATTEGLVDGYYTFIEKQKENPTDAKLERVIEAARRVLNNWLDGSDCPDVSGDFGELEYAIRKYDGEEKQKGQKPGEKQDYSGLSDLERAVHRGFLCAGVEDVPVSIIKETAKDCLAQVKTVEWSEEDEEVLGKLHRLLVICQGEIPTSEYEKLDNWLRSLPEKFNLQPEQEWSEKDFEKLVGDLVQDIVANEKDAANYGDKKKPTSFFVDKYADKFRKMQPKVEWSEDIIQKAVKEVGLTQHQIDWFKTNVFPPKQEWNEEDENAFQYLHKLISFGYTKKVFDARTAADMWEWLDKRLKSLRPQPHWKPTEEQMEALKCAIADVARFSKRGGRQVELENEPYYSALHSLYEQLKKL